LNWQPAINGFKNYILLERSLSKNTIDAYLRDVEKLVMFLKLKELDRRLD